MNLFVNLTVYEVMSRRIQESLYARQSPARVNIWNTLDIVKPSHNLLCAGIEMSQPWSEFDGSVYTMSFKAQPRPTNIDQYCDHFDEIRDAHPSFIARDKQQKVDDVLSKYISQGNSFWKFQRLIWQNWLDCGPGMECYWPRDAAYDLRLVGPPMHWVTSYAYYEDLCREKYPEYSDLDIQKCVTAYGLVKGQEVFDTYERLSHAPFGFFWDRSIYLDQYDDYLDNEWWKATMYFACKRLLDIVLLLYLLEIHLPWPLVLTLAALVNMTATMPWVLQPFTRTGFDFTAYIN